MRFRVEFLFFFFIGVSSRLRLRHRAALKKAATDFDARAERVSPISLSFSLSKTIKVVFFCGSLRRRRPSQKSEKKESTSSVVFLFFSAKTDTKKTQKTKKISLTTFTLTLTTTTNDNIKTVWRAWTNSKSPKAEETKGTEI